MEKSNHYSHRLLARIVIQAETPLAVGSGDSNVFTDRLISRDVNGLPYIPGTAVAGVLRHAIEEKENVQFFGYRGSKADHGKGSEIIFSSAQIVDSDGTVIEGLRTNQNSNYLQRFDHLPVRQHVRMNDRGTAVAHGKFDEEVVYKGTRFCFEIEMVASSDDATNFNKVLLELVSDTIRIGGGTRKGFGEISIVECKQTILDLFKEADLTSYIEKTSSLNDRFWNDLKPDGKNKDNSEGWITYKLALKPDDFFFFGSGFGNEKADMTAVSEAYVDWSSGKPEFKDNAVLIPGSSVKGALSHRIAFHYNKIKKYYADNPEAKIGVGGDNLAVQALFGCTRKVKESGGNEKEVLQRGNVLISDVIQAKKVEQHKILNHVSIDRFTGGAIDGALFSEEVTYGKGEVYTLTFRVKNDVLKDGAVQQAFEDALTDITTGMLPLGGGVNRGHGCFSGTWTIINKEDKQ
jgi:CRISPR/Cas system CMR subunit Cmr4 (Cas7 group RAMP superfamily)